MRRRASFRLKCPEPRPPLAARPTRLSVTEIEHWLRDPYTIYAKHILKLPRLDAGRRAARRRDRGTAIHAAIGEFAKALRATVCPRTPMGAHPHRPRAFRAARRSSRGAGVVVAALSAYRRWFADFERQRHGRMAAAHVEVFGELTIPLGDRSFRLTGRADRIERLADGRYAILDFKTGKVPSDKQVEIGVAPQLTLEAAMLRNGGFADVGDRAASLAELVYVQLKGGEPPGKESNRPVQGQQPRCGSGHSAHASH